MSEAEQRFAVYISARMGVDTPASRLFWEKGGLRTVAKNNRLRKELLSGTPFWVKSPITGRFEESRTFKWPPGSHNPVIRKITRGLYYHHFGKTLDATADIDVYFFDKLDKEIKELAMSGYLSRRNLGGDDRFCYAYAQIAENPQMSLWIYQFYMRHWAAAITKPHGFELETAAIDIVINEAAPDAPQLN